AVWAGFEVHSDGSILHLVQLRLERSCDRRLAHTLLASDDRATKNLTTHHRLERVQNAFATDKFILPPNGLKRVGIGLPRPFPIYSGVLHFELERFIHLLPNTGRVGPLRFHIERGGSVAWQNARAESHRECSRCHRS